MGYQMPEPEAPGEIRPAAPVATPEDPQPNKAIVAAVGTLVTTGLRWVISGELELDDEGVVALAGALTTALVYAVSNWKRLLS
jgi:hypothetical protein